MARTYNPPTRINGVRTAPFGAILGALQLGNQLGSMMPDNDAGNYMKGVLNPLANTGASISYMTEGKIGKGLLSLIPGMGTFLQSKDEAKREEERKAKALAIETANYNEAMRQSSVSDLYSYNPTNSVTMYPTGGVIGKNPVPNKLIINRSKVIKYVNGEPTTHYIDKIDTMVGQDYGSWGENLQGVNIPAPFAVDANGKLFLTKRQTPETIAKMPNGGNISGRISPLSMGSANEFNPAYGSPMTQGATTVTTPAGSTAGYHETGQNIPIIDNNGVVKAIAEPGEVVVDDMVISKRNGLAQKYIAIDKQKQALVEKLDKAKSAEARAGLSRSISFYDKQLDLIKVQQEELAKQTPQQQTPVASNGVTNLNDPKNEINLGVSNYGWNIASTPTPDYNYAPQYTMNEVTDPLAAPNAEVTTVTPEVNSGIDGDKYKLANQSNFDKFNPYKGLDVTIDMPVMPYSQEAMSEKYGYKPKDYALNFATNPSNTNTDEPKSIDWNNTLKNITQIGSMILPFATNYKNSKLMDKSMAEIESRRPMLTKINNIQPDYQIGDQVAAVNGNYATMNEVAAKVGNPLAASSIMDRANADRISAINKIVGDKNRADAQAYSQQVALNNQIGISNTSMINADANFKLENRLSLNNAKINLNNTTTDNLYTMLQDQNLKEKDRITLTMAIKALNQYGTVTRKLADEVYTMSKGSIDLRDKVKD